MSHFALFYCDPVCSDADVCVQRRGPLAMQVYSSELVENSRLRRNWRKMKKKSAKDDEESSSGSSDEEYLRWEPQHPAVQQESAARRSTQNIGAMTATANPQTQYFAKPSGQAAMQSHGQQPHAGEHQAYQSHQNHQAYSRPQAIQQYQQPQYTDGPRQYKVPLVTAPANQPQAPPRASQAGTKRVV